MPEGAITDPRAVSHSVVDEWISIRCAGSRACEEPGTEHGEAKRTQHSVTDGREEKGKTGFGLGRTGPERDTHRHIVPYLLYVSSADKQ